MIDVDIVSQVIINKKDDMPCAAEFRALSILLEQATGIQRTAFMPYFAQLAEEITTNYMNIQYSVPYGDAIKHWETEAFIAYGNNKRSYAVVRPARSEQPAEAFIAGLSHMAGVAAVPASNMLRIDLGIMQPPVSTLEMSAVKDTFVRESMPTLSYGQSQSMACGRAADGRYTGLLEFNTTAFDAVKGKVIRDIYLEVNNLGNPATLNLNYVLDNFSEYYVMWITPIRHQFIKTVELKRGINKIPLSEIIPGRMRLSFTGDMLAVFKTRESGTGPRIVVEYSEKGWSGYLGKLHMTNEVIIQAAKKKDLYSSYRLARHLLMEGEAIIRDVNSTVGEITISKPMMIGAADMMQHNSINSEAYVRARNDITARADNNTITNSSEVDVRQWRDLVGYAGLLGDVGDVQLPSNVDIIRTYITGLADVFMHLTGSAGAYVTHSSVLGAQVSISKGDITSRVNTRRVKDIIGKGIVEAGVANDFVSRADIRKSVLPSRYQLRKSKDLVSNAIVKGYYGFDTPASAYIIRSILLGKAAIARQLNTDVRGEAIIRAIGNSDIVSGLDVLHVDSNGQVSIRRDAFLDRPAEAMVRRTSFEHLAALVEILNHSSITGRLEVQQVKDIVGSAWFRLIDVSDTFAEAYIKGWYNEHHPAEVDIRRPFSDLISYTTIRTAARQWKPMVGKLPRQWKREDFL